MHFVLPLALLDENSNMAAGIAAMGIGFWLFFVVVLIFEIYLMWRIAAKAGYPGAASLLMLIPVVNLIVFIYFAFAEWPIERQARGGQLVR